MTGLLSVFSLLPVQALTKGEDSRQEVEEEPETPGIKPAADGESSDKDAER